MTSSRKPRRAASPDSAPATAAGRKSRARPARTPSEASGNWNPDWEPFARLDPAWTEKMIGMSMAPAVSGALDAKTIEFIGIALNVACNQLHAMATRRHIRRALELGATKQQITAVLQLASLQGLHSLCLGAPILLEQLAALKRRGD